MHPFSYLPISSFLLSTPSQYFMFNGCSSIFPDLLMLAVILPKSLPLSCLHFLHRHVFPDFFPEISHVTSLSTFLKLVICLRCCLSPATIYHFNTRNGKCSEYLSNVFNIILTFKNYFREPIIRECQTTGEKLSTQKCPAWLFVIRK